jgi:hypothetical protein
MTKHDTDMVKSLEEIVELLEARYSGLVKGTTAKSLMHDLQLGLLQMTATLTQVPVSRDLFYTTQILRAFFVVAHRDGILLSADNVEEYSVKMLEEVKANIKAIIDKVKTIKGDECGSCPDKTCPDRKALKPWAVPPSMSKKVH